MFIVASKFKWDDSEPKPDIAICEECGWRGSVDDCYQDTEGDWETGYYEVDCCPECGGPVDYDMSDERYAEWEAWAAEQDLKKKTNSQEVASGVCQDEKKS